MFCIKAIVNNKVIDVMYCYTGILFVVLHKGGFRAQFYLQEICRDAHELSGTNKVTCIWECCISYSTLIWYCFWVPQNHRRVVSTGRNGCRFCSISSIF